MRTVPISIAAALLLAGCATVRRPCPAPCPPPDPCAVRPTTRTAPEHEQRAYDGVTGRPTSLTAFLAKARNADLVAFGELHGHLVGAAWQKVLLERLAAEGRPVALAMEFFERDQQEAVDAYLAGTMDYETFAETTSRNDAYERTHRPLVDYAKKHGMPVIAANAPRRLVSGWRKSGEPYFEDYASTLSDEDRPYLAEEVTLIKDGYWERFESLMGPQMAPAFFRGQSLWDDTMAESMARFRATHPDHRILFVVGGFHVTEKLGTITKYLLRRPDDNVAVLVMHGAREGPLDFDEDDQAAGDLVLKVRLPKPKGRGPNPHEKTMPPPTSPHETKAMPPTSPHETEATPDAAPDA